MSSSSRVPLRLAFVLVFLLLLAIAPTAMAAGPGEVAAPPSAAIEDERPAVVRPTAIAAEAAGPDSIAASLIVDGSCTDTDSNGICDDNVTYKTIQKAIDNAAAGDTVNVLAGVYTENVVVSTSLTLAGAGAATTTIRPATSGPQCTSGGGSICPGGVNLVAVQANNVVISGFTLDGDNPSLTSGTSVNGADLDARNGIVTDHTAVSLVTGLEVHHVIVKNIYLRGIYASTSGGTFNFHDNEVANVAGEGASIGIFNFGGSGTIADNTVTLANDAIAANHSSGTQFLRNTVTQSGSGVHSDNNGSGGGIADLLQGNHVSNCAANGYGVWTFGSYLGTVVDQNTVTGCAVGLSLWGQFGTATQQFTNNIVTGAAGTTGVYITTDLISYGYTDVVVNFTGNVIAGNAEGIYFSADDQSWNPKPYVAETISATFSNNSIAGNIAQALIDADDTDGIYQIDASGNWWGSADPAAVKAAANSGSRIDYTPWLAVGTDTSAAAGFQGDFSTLWADDDSPQTGTVGRVQEGINLVTSGGTVNVAAGTYVEDLQIDKAVTLLGPNATINPNTGTRVPEALLHPATSKPDPDVCTNMAYLSTSNITIKGFTFDGDNPALTSGVIINGADVDACEVLSGYDGMGHIVVENNILKNATYAGIDFYNYYNGTAATSDNYIRFNKIDGIGEMTYERGIGILITRNFYADVTDNVITHTRTGLQVDYHNKINPGATGRVANNQVSTWRLGLFLNQQWTGLTPFVIEDNTFTAENYPGATKWSGILVSSVEGTANTTIEDNTITIPIGVTYAAPGYTAGYNVWNVTTTAPIAITGGTVTGGDYGVFVNNYEGYVANAGNTAIKVDGVAVLGSKVAGVYVKDSSSNTNNATVYANIQHSTIDTEATGILVEGADATAKANLNNLAGNPTFGVSNTNPAATVDAKNNWWGTACSPASQVSGVVDYTPWWGDATGSFSLSANATAINVGDSAAQQMAVINCAASGTTITYPTGTYPGGVIVTANNVTINLNGATVSAGSPAYTIVGDDVTLMNGILDGTGNTDGSAGVLVTDGADNFILQNMEIRNWGDGVEVAGAHESLKVVNNWIHLNTGAGLQVNAGAALTGNVTVQGNLFKANGVGITSAVALNAEYNSWGTKAAPAAMANVDADPWTFSELYFDVDSTVAGDQYLRHVNETNAFDVTLMAEAENLYGLGFKFTYDAGKLTLNTKTLQAPWAGRCAELPRQPVGTVAYVCNLLNEAEWDGGAIATFNFTANAGPLGNGPWTALFDLSPVVADTFSAARGGIKVFVNNAGFDAPSTTDRNIVDNNDGEITIDGLANYTGFVDLQGRANDSGALFEVYNQAAKASATVYANGTTASSGKLTTSYATTWQLVIGQTYYFQVDRALYLPTTAVAKYLPSEVLPTDWQHSRKLETRPLESVKTVMLLGGDATDNNVIDIDDASCIGGQYGLTPAACGTGGTSDVNEDGKMDILDLTLMGGNFTKTASPAPATWVP